jgi:hypothetical protein
LQGRDVERNEAMRDTIDMAREVYGAHTEWTGAPLDRLEQLVALVRADEREKTNRRANASWTRMCKKMVAAEREACAKVCEELVPDMSRTANDASVWDVATFDCAIAIRARKNT